MPIALGTDEGGFIPFVRAYNTYANLCVVHIDAHIDWRHERHGVLEGYSSGMRRASEMPWVKAMAQVGLRGIGSARQQEIDDAIENCNKIVALMSPNYFASPECKEELMIARLRNKRSNFEVLFPLYWKDAGRALAMWIQAVTYSDCREGDSARLAEVTTRLAARLRSE